MIKICDAIMGSGKTSAAINYMNSHPTQKFIYITPYLEEAERIRNSCPNLHFREPSDKLKEFSFRKFEHTAELISSGANITSTHNMFLRYSDDMVDMIRKHNYTLIIDEAVDMLRPITIKPSDLEFLKNGGWASIKDGVFKVELPSDYKDGVFSKVASLSRGNRLVSFADTGENGFYYWLFSKDIFMAFKDVFVLTYLFDAQTMKYYFDLSGIKYENIGIARHNNDYTFCDTPQYIPEYVKELKDKIHIFDNAKINSVGDNKCSLSATWFERSGETANKHKKELKRNIDNFFNHYHRGEPSKVRLWATYKSGESSLRAKGYSRSNIAFNAKATNSYRHKQVLAYCVNIFMVPIEKNYLINSGVDVKEDKYALSVMLQWIWRSAIRDGQEIWIYIPSKRMRNLLKDWIEDTQKQYCELNNTENEDVERGD